MNKSADVSVARCSGQVLQESLQKPKHTAKSLEDLIFTCPNRIKGKPCWIVGQEKKGRREGGTENELLSVSRKRKLPSSSSCVSTNDSTTSTSTSSECSKNTTTPSTRNNLGDVSETFQNTISTFLSSGCCILTQALPQSFITSSKTKITQDFHKMQNQLQLKKQKAIASNDIHLLSRCSRGDFRELVDRDGGRRDIRFQLDRFPFTSPGLVYNSVVYPVVKELLGGSDDVTLLYAGIMWALPFTDADNNSNNTSNGQKSIENDAKSQKWHGDGGHLFDHVHLPPHCINVFYPLVDIHTQNGPTDVKVGTHRLGHFNDDEHHSSNGNIIPNDVTQLSLTCNVGDAILFDYRLKHRGGVNLTLEPRPVLYLAYAKSFFRDVGNTRSGHSLFDSHESTTTSSPPWVSRILNGDEVLYGHGFDDSEAVPTTTESDVLPCNSNDDRNGGKKTIVSETTHQNGSGERWILFKMNVELPDCDEPKILTVYHGDVAIEVSTQFCKSNGLGDDFIPVLGSTIQSQIDSVKD